MKPSFVAIPVLLAIYLGAARAEEQPSPSQQTCPVDTTGQGGNGVKVCYDDHSASIGGSVSGKELDHFLKYPIGRSDKSVAKQVGNAVHHFFSHL
ncbi:hypothetical protein EN813_038415 [Mesorhizobium sp. M00.F.Ca.ET.170.01.1.1]|nr:hypothetical protein EN813_038415 [Mesorhizobium sp. M00.F.Ca.ET.170.01.1.1]